MSLSNDLIAQFVNVVNDTGKTSPNTEVNGTIKEHGGAFRVKLDGSDILTPVNTYTELKDGERVSVKIVDHRATVVGNATSPSVGAETVKNIAGGQIGEFELVVTERLEADEAEIGSLKTSYAEIDKLVAKKIDAEEVETNYLKADLAEIEEAWINDLLVKGSIVTPDVNSATGSFSRYLTGVKIVGDLIEANTIKADKLIVQGTDGIYRRLNIDSLGQVKVDSDPKYNSKLDGSVIVAESITATQINVADLFAQDITATGTITGATLTGTTGDFTGTITANDGKIGFLYVDGNRLYGDFVETSDQTDYEFSKTFFNATIYPSNATSWSQRLGSFQLNSYGAYIEGKAGIGIRTNDVIAFDNIDNNSSKTVQIDIGGTGPTLTVIGDGSFTGKIESWGESKFFNNTYCPTIQDTAPNVGCAFKASRGLFNEALIDKLIMTAGTGKLPFYKYTGASGGQMSGLAEVASIGNTGTFSGAGVSVTGTISANNATIASTLEVKGSIQAKGGLELYHASTPYFDFHYGGTTTDYTSRVIETSSGTLAVNGVRCKSGGYLTAPGASSFGSTLSVSGITTISARIQPNADIAVQLGTGSLRYLNVYCQHEQMNTSDLNKKRDLVEIDDRYIRLFDLTTPYSYGFIDGDRRHTGFISQYVESALLEAGLTPEEVGFFCKDVKMEYEYDENGNYVSERVVYDENGQPVYNYYLRNGEYIAIMAAKIKKLERELEVRLAALESKGEN